MLHADPGFALTIGARVTVGHQAMLHGCTIGDGSLVGIQAVVMNGAMIGRHCLVGAGAIVTEGKSFGERSLIIGAPAKVARLLNDEEVAGLERAAAGYVERRRTLSQEPACGSTRPEARLIRSTRMADLFENPMGLMGFEFVEFASPHPGHARAGVREARLHAGREAPLEGRRAVPPGRDQLHRQPRAEELRRLLRRRARAFGVRPRLSRARFAQGLFARPRARRPAARHADRADGAAPAGDQGHRRRAALPDRPLRGRQVDLRHRLRVPARRRSAPGRPRPEDARPPDAQRLPRPDGVLGQLLRAPVQLPRDPLLRHPGRVHRPHVEGDDRARRQDPHSAQRGVEEGLGPDRGVPDEVQRRGHPARRAAHRRPARHHRQAARWPACR